MARVKLCACNSIPHRPGCVYQPIITPLPGSVVALLVLRETDALFRTVQNATDLFHKIKGDNGQNNCQLCASLPCWQAPADRIALQYKEACAALRNGRLLPGRESAGWTGLLATYPDCSSGMGHPTFYTLKPGR